MAHLDKLSLIKAPKQGREIQALVERESSWLAQDRPEMPALYDDRWSAMRNVGSLAVSKTSEYYIVREKRHSPARGLAGIVFNQTVKHPTEGEITGNYLDYWLDKKAPQWMHLDTVRELMDKNGYYYYDPVAETLSHGMDFHFFIGNSGETHSNPCFVTLPENAVNPSVGFEAYGSGPFPTGKPVHLGTELAKGPFGGLSNSRPCQVLYMPDFRGRPYGGGAMAFNSQKIIERAESARRRLRLNQPEAGNQ